MKFATFADAYSHNKRSKEHLINLIRTGVDQTPEFALFLGAGASVSSDVKSANKMIGEWCRKLFASHKGEEDFESWREKQEWYSVDDQYSRLFEIVYDQPSQRRAYIEKCVRNAKPGWGYAYLSSLIERKIFNVIFTTNFDDLINEACFQFTNTLRPMVCAHDSAVTSVRLMSDRPKVVKLHGDFLYDSIKNTSSELQSLEANMRAKFIEFAKEYGLIVVGYSGHDQSIMDILDVLVRSSNYFRNGIYWCIQPSSSPSRRLRQLLRNDRTYWVEIEGFDEFMAEIADSSKIDLPDGIITPHKTAINRTKHLIEKIHSFKCPPLVQACSDLKEVYQRVDNALKDVGLGEWNLRDDGTKDYIGELSDQALPLLRSHEYMSKNNLKQATEILKKLASQTTSSVSKTAWNLLMECLLRDPNSHDEAKDLLSQAPPQIWQDSTHYLQSAYYSLCLNLYEYALTFANRALELNSDLAPAKVNKAMALLISNNEEGFKPLIEELKSNKYAEHHRAAAYALVGNFDTSIKLLQRSFVLGRYSPSNACKDVVFRVFWGLPEFEEKLKPFASGNKLDYPYKHSCPMSTTEEKLHKDIVTVLKDKKV